MTGKYVLAITENGKMYACWNKVYVNENRARQALELMQNNYTLDDRYKVHQITGLEEVK